MNILEGIVVGLVFLLVGAGLCLLGLFCFWTVRMMKDLQESARQVVASSNTSLTEAKQIVAQVKEVFGENSPVARAAKSVSILANTMPETMAGLKQFTEVFGAIYKTAFQQDKVERVVRQSSPEDESQVIGYDEAQAAQFEEMARHRKERLGLSEEELGSMRTDNVREVPPVPEEPTATA